MRPYVQCSAVPGDNTTRVSVQVFDGTPGQGSIRVFYDVHTAGITPEVKDSYAHMYAMMCLMAAVSHIAKKKYPYPRDAVLELVDQLLGRGDDDRGRGLERQGDVDRT